MSRSRRTGRPRGQPKPRDRPSRSCCAELIAPRDRSSPAGRDVPAHAHRCPAGQAPRRDRGRRLGRTRGSDDVTVLDAATADGRRLVTENVRDVAVLVRYTRHAGVLLVHARRWPRTRAGLHTLVDTLHAALSGDRMPGPDDIRWLA